MMRLPPCLAKAYHKAIELLRSRHHEYPGEINCQTSDEAVTAIAERDSARVTSRPMEREDWNRRYAAAEFIWTVEANRFLAAEAANLHAGSALDLAAGEGRTRVWLAERGWTPRAVDVSNAAIEKGKNLAAKRNVADKIGFVDADLRKYEIVWCEPNAG
ncbi:MAG: methyltransferase [Noviherbaspirillum sp.]|nr:methyltransferase [Noviherbaspirillum sp.]